MKGLIIWIIASACQFQPADRGRFDAEWQQNRWEITHDSCIRLAIDPKVEDSIYADMIFDDIQLIKLETRPDNYIEFADNIIAHENKFYVLDAHKSKSINVFDQTGNYLFAVGNDDDQERFLRPDDLTFIPYRNELMVSDDNERQVFHYAMDGTYQQSFYHPYFMREYARLNANTQLYYLGGMANPEEYGDLEYQLIFTDNRHQVISKHFPKKYQYEINKHFYPYKYSINFLNGYRDTIYRINSKEIRASYALDFGEYRLPSNYLFDDLARFDEWSQKEIVFLMTHITETDDVLYFVFTFLGEAKSVIYSKKSGKLLTGRGIFHESFGNLMLTQPAVWENKWIFSIHPQHFIDAYKHLKVQSSPESWARFQKKHPDFVEIANSTKALDNPILMIVDLKDF